MRTTAVRLYGKDDLRLETFALPPVGEDEILARVVSDSLCMSSYKAAKQGAAHKRVPDNVAEAPVIIGHEFCGELVTVGKKWADTFRPGERFTVQPALNYRGSLDAPGYSYPYTGGDATYILLPNEVMEMGCLLPCEADAYFYGSLTEPMSCIVGAFRAQYHTAYGSYVHEMGPKAGGCMALLAAAGPMGMGALDYALQCEARPRLLVVTDIDEEKLARMARLFPVEAARKAGVALQYFNTKKDADAEETMRALTGGNGFDDVFCFAPVRPVVEMGDRLLGRDGCLNFFAGPTDPEFRAEMNFYNVHYAFTHLVGTSGGNTDDMREAIALMRSGRINPAMMITHIGGLDAVAEATKSLPSIPGGKKLIYTHISMPLTPIDAFAALGEQNPLYLALAESCARHHGLWNAEAEQMLLANAAPLEIGENA